MSAALGVEGLLHDVRALVSAAKEIDKQAWGHGYGTISAHQVKRLGFAREGVETALAQQPTPVAVEEHKRRHAEGMEAYNATEHAAGRTPRLQDSIDAGTAHVLARQPVVEAQPVGCDCGANAENRWPHHDECSIYAQPPSSAPVGEIRALRVFSDAEEIVSNLGKTDAGLRLAAMLRDEVVTADFQSTLAGVIRHARQPAAVDEAALREVARQMQTRYEQATHRGIDAGIIAQHAVDVAHTLARWANDIEAALGALQGKESK